MIKKIEKLIRKINNIEERNGRVERNFFLDGKMWVIGRISLFKNGKKTNEEEQKEFIKLKEDFESL